MNLVSFIAHLAIVLVLLWGAFELLKIFPIPAPFNRVLYVLLVVLGAIWVINALVGFSPGFRLNF